MVVEGGWILRAMLVLLGVSLVCGYLTFCLLFYQGQWQMVLHPVRTERRPATIGGRGYEVVRFGPDATGVPQRVGWWQPASATGDFRHLAVLYLPSVDGSLADETETLDALSRMGVAMLAVNWRGYGESAALRRPSERSMREDAEAGWQWLTATHGLSGARLIPYGRGVGAAVALEMARRHGQTPAMILDGPRFDLEREVAADPRVRLLPVGLLFKDRFALEPMLGESKVPKLIVTRGPTEDGRVLSAGDPKMTLALPQFEAGAFEALVRRFLGQYAPPTPEPLLIPAKR